MEIHVLDIRNKLIVFSVITGIFLPARMLFYIYVSPHWLGSLGLASSIMIAMTVLAHKNKLGRFGVIFIDQMTKIMRGRSGKMAIVLSLIMIVYLGTALVFIERGNTIYFDEKQIVSQLVFSHYELSTSQAREVSKILQTNQNNMFFGFSHFDQIASMTYAIMNDMMGGWLVNLNTILLIEQFEMLGLMFFYRRFYVNRLNITVEQQVKSIRR